MKPASAFVAHLAEVFRSFGEVRAKPMFGGHGLYHQGLMIGLVADDTLYLKVDAETQPSFARAGSVPFTYVKNGKAMAMAYHSAPAEIFDDADVARRWATLAYGAALRSKHATQPPSSPRSKPKAARRPA
jgi:DNA transformation protein